ncbi:MAG: hypothetical protein AAFW84_25595 [Cyanobacteria bacterium J06635_15]
MAPLKQFEREQFENESRHLLDQGLSLDEALKIVSSRYQPIQADELLKLKQRLEWEARYKQDSDKDNTIVSSVSPDAESQSELQELFDSTYESEANPRKLSDALKKLRKEDIRSLLMKISTSDVYRLDWGGSTTALIYSLIQVLVEKNQLSEFISILQREYSGLYRETPSQSRSFLQTARSLQLDGPSDWSSRLDYYLYALDKDE